MKGHWLWGCLWFCCGISCIVYGVTDSIDVQVSTEMAKTLKAGSITDANPQVGKSSVPGSSSGSSVGTTKDVDKSPIIILVLLSMLFFLVFLCRYCAASSDLEGPITEPVPEICDDPRSMKITIEELLEGTDNFSDKNILGKGGFGVVYRGQLRNGTMIAVKRWEEDISLKGREEEIPVKRREANSSKAFDAEINALTKIRHRHLVSLLGYCTDSGEKMLVYEYMPQGPLSQHLFEWKKAGLRPLEWKQRLIIALDVAHGVQYLHNLARDSFIHRDLKPSNVLLGADMRAKISDFGLAKLARDGNFSVSNTIAGTYGYIAPEYAEEVTTKGDVYSFGVVLMELITGRRALDETQPHEFMHLATWFRRVIVDGVSGESFRKAVDPVLHMTDDTFGSICKVAELARQCTAREPLRRPDMGHAVHVLSPLVAPFERTVSEDQGLREWLKREWQNLTGGASSLEARTTHSYQARFRQTVQRTKCL